MNKKLLVAACGCMAIFATGCQPNAQPPREYAVYAEYGDEDKAMEPNWNTRIFNRSEVQHGTTIALDQKTGVVTLSPGTYHVTASSIVMYYEPKNPSLVAAISAPAAGYARLASVAQVDAEKTDPALTGTTNPSPSTIDKSNKQALSIGTGSTANMIPSLIDTFVSVDRSTPMVLQHQIGYDVKGVYLHINGNGSAWHIAARITIERV